MKQLIRYGEHTQHQKDIICKRIQFLEVEEKCEFEVTVKYYKPSKSSDQLGYYFKIIVPIVADYMGETAKGAHMALKHECLVFTRSFKNFNGDTVVERPSIKDLKINEMAQYITSVIQFMGSMGVTIPPPTRRGE